MKVSELIEALKVIVAEKGDMEVLDSYGCEFEMEVNTHIAIHDDETTALSVSA